MTMAVGIISSSGCCAETVLGGWGDPTAGFKGGEPPAEEKSELLWGERDLPSDGLLSIHCYINY